MNHTNAKRRVAVTGLDAHQRQQAGADPTDDVTVHADAGLGHALDEGEHRQGSMGDARR